MISENQIHVYHISRINQALHYIDDHLDSDLSLDTIAGVAYYSPFHFHRIFKTVIGETLNSYIRRRRIEKTAAVLMRKKEVSITELSIQYGFKSNSSFTRAFKKFYGVSPTLFQKSNPGKYSKIRTMDSKNGQENAIFEAYICSINYVLILGSAFACKIHILHLNFDYFFQRNYGYVKKNKLHYGTKAKIFGLKPLPKISTSLKTG